MKASPTNLIAILLLVGAGTVLIVWLLGREKQEKLGLAAASQPHAPAAARFEISIRKPGEQLGVETGLVNVRGEAVTVACVVCHSIREPDPSTTTTEALDEFHTGLYYAHGALSCLSCHNSQDYGQLRLANGTPLEVAETMTLCAQCHGPQARDYRRGSHGGMQGYWDLSRGPRVRNTCTNCHDPHAPGYPVVMPVFAPRDREVVSSDGIIEGRAHHD